MVGSIWSVVGGWILLHRCRMMVQLMGDRGVPILMGWERTANFEAGSGSVERACPVWQTCRVLVSGRLVRTLTFPHLWLTREDSRRGLVFVALGARAVDGLLSLVGSGMLVGMARMLVWKLPLSGTVRPLRRSCPQRPVSGLGKNQQRVWRLLTMTRSGLILGCWELYSWVMVEQRRPCALNRWKAGRLSEGLAARGMLSALQL